MTRSPDPGAPVSDASTWIFGYGSLIWRPGFEYLERRAGWIVGWTRRFYQGSPDHRGTPRAPGRVVTLLREPEARCHGVAYRLDASVATVVLGQLDHREIAGYERHAVRVHALDHAEPIEALCYLAGPGNPSWLGEAPLAEMARHIATSHGPSGANLEYLLELGRALRELDADDPHVFALEQAVRAEVSA